MHPPDNASTTARPDESGAAGGTAASGGSVVDLRDTLRLQPDSSRPGRFAAAIDPGWAIVYAFGGVSMAMSVQAARAGLARDDLDLVSASTTFISPVPCGPVSIDVDVLRSGGRAAQVGADLRVAGASELGVRTTATFGRRDPDAPIQYRAVEFPADVADPLDCPTDEVPPDIEPRWGGLRFNEQHETRIAVGAPFWDRQGPPQPARAAWWTRMRIPPRLPDGRIDPAALCVPADFLGPAVGLPLGAGAPDAFVLSLQIDLHLVADTTSEWTLREAEVVSAGDGFVSGVTRLWDGERRLVGVALQRANLRVVTPDDPGAFARR